MMGDIFEEWFQKLFVPCTFR